MHGENFNFENLANFIEIANISYRVFQEYTLNLLFAVVKFKRPESHRCRPKCGLRSYEKLSGKVTFNI